MTFTRTQLFTAGLTTALLFAAAAVIPSARAIEGESIVLSPASNRLTIDAGKTRKGTLKVINDGTVAYDFVVYASPYSVSNGAYVPNYEEKKQNTDLYTWITFEKKEYTLNPGQNVNVPYTITVPSDAAPGGHYGVIFAETQADESNGQIARKKRVGSIVYSTVNGDYITAGKQLSTQIDWLQLGGPVAASVTVENTGNVDYIMSDLFEVKSVLGGVTYSKKSEHIVLPKTTRDIAMSWDNGPIMGLYNVKVETKVLDKITTKRTWVLLMPMWILVLSVLAITGIIYWAVRARRR